MTTAARNAPLMLGITAAATPDQPLIYASLVIGMLIEFPHLTALKHLLLRHMGTASQSSPRDTRVLTAGSHIPIKSMKDINQQALDIIHQWIGALNDGLPSKAAALYADDALLLPTFSPRSLSLPATRLSYLETLAGRSGLHVELHKPTVRFHQLSAAMVVASGIYRFSFSVDGEPLAFEARFTMLVCPLEAGPIRHHHSSQVPRGLS